MRRISLLTLSIFTLVVLSACGGGGGDPAAAVERYLTAKVGRDADTVRALLCSEMEHELERETRAFETVSDARIEGLSCAVAGDDSGDEAIVSCDGRIVASYGLQETEFDLSSYRVVKEDGEWRWCGEGE